jgi:putative membrane protein
LGILFHIIGNAIALLATTIVPGISFHGNWLTLFLAGLVFGVFNLIVRPIAFFLSFPVILLTLGLFYFVLNGILLWLAQFVVPGYQVSTLWAGILGSIVFTVVNWILGALFGKKK